MVDVQRVLRVGVQVCVGVCVGACLGAVGCCLLIIQK